MTQLQPAGLFHYFHQICQVPRESGNEQGIILFLQQFAADHNLTCRTDSAGNVVICKPASKGMEHKPVVVLQSHMDMVCEKNEDTVFDFSKDAIQYYVEDGWLKARGTTLGADDGIGMAAQLAVLADDTIIHGPVECLFTVSEETGLDGARALRPGFISGNILLNLDSEDDGEIFIGCAGGIDTTARFTYTPKSASKEGVALKFTVTGGVGGHSGDDINKDRCNAVQTLARFLWNARQSCSFDIARFAGGNKHNAIAREASAICVINPLQVDALTALFDKMAREWEEEHRHTDPKLTHLVTKVEAPAYIIDPDTAQRLVSALYACPHGVLAMSKEIPGLVETSTNLASVKMDKDGEIRIGTSQRSDVNSARFNAGNRIESLFALAGAQVAHESEYPGWAPNNNSPILKVCVAAYKQLFNEDLKVKAIHAGLECGLFLESFPTLDMVSFGPTLRGVHAPGEKLEISTAVKFWDFLLAILKNI